MTTITSPGGSVHKRGPVLATLNRIDRRRRDAHAARFAERVTDDARWLPAQEAALVRGTYQCGQSAGQLAAIAGVSKYVVQRRLRKVIERTLRPGYRYAARCLELATDAPTWPPDSTTLRQASEPVIHLAVLRAVFIEGLSQRAAAKKLGITRFAVRRHHALARLEIEAWLKGNPGLRGPRVERAAAPHRPLVG